MNIYLALFYTSKDRDYNKNLNFFLKNYKKFGIKDVFLYTEECIPKEFEWLYKDFFIKHKRGYGYWAWKPLIIYESLKKIKKGDMLLYHDVGRSCYPFGIKYSLKALAEYVKINHKGIGIAEGPFSHEEFSKRDAFYYMGCDEKECWNLNQLSATWSFWENSDLSKKFVLDWIKWSFHSNEIITDSPNKCGLPNLPKFKDNRHDQTILTNLLYLYKKNGTGLEPLKFNGWEKDVNNCIKKVDKDAILVIEPEIKDISIKNAFNEILRKDTNVVITHFNHDLAWLAKARHSFNSIILCDKIDSKSIPLEVKNQFDCKSCPTIPNEGSDTKAILNYIINNYENLNERTAFVHGHETFWHQQNPLGLINAILTARTDKYGFVSLNTKHHPGAPYWVYDRRENRGKMVLFMEKYWEEYFYPYLGNLPQAFAHDCCAQFIVRKDRILKHPKEAYQKWFNLYRILQDKEGDNEWGKEGKSHASYYSYMFEFIWHFIFGEDPVINENERNLGYLRARFF